MSLRLLQAQRRGIEQKQLCSGEVDATDPRHRGGNGVFQGGGLVGAIEVGEINIDDAWNILNGGDHFAAIDGLAEGARIETKSGS